MLPTTPIVTVDPDTDGYTNRAIQTTVDALARAGGGRVRIPAGHYMMHDALHLRSGVDIVGYGEVVLQKVPSVQTPIADFVGYGHYEFTVRDPDLLDVGMGIHLTDDNAVGFYETVATIVGREGDLFFIDRMLNHDYLPVRHATATTLYPIVDGHDVQDASLRGVVLDGNPAETRPISGCRGGGVFLLGCHRMELRDLEIRHYHGDGLSFQQCTDVWVTGCEIHHNRGGGLHPGSGTVRYILRHNHIHHNDANGIFYCLRTPWSICMANTIEHNGEAGISVGERDTHHLICRNTIAHNGGPGIDFRDPQVRSGDDCVVKSNTITSNAGGGIVVADGLQRISILENTIKTGNEPPILVGDATDIHVYDNTIDGLPQDAGLDLGPAITEPPVTQPAVGPAAAPLDSVRHLNLPPLTEWQDRD